MWGLRRDRRCQVSVNPGNMLYESTALQACLCDAIAAERGPDGIDA